MMLNVESFQVIVSKIVERSLTKELKRELYIECWCRPPPAPAQTESQHINVFNRVEIGRSFRRRVAMAEDCCKRIKIEAFVPPQPSPPGHVSTFKYQTHYSEALLLSSLGTVVFRPTMEFQKQRTGHWYGIFVCLLPLINLGAAMRAVISILADLIFSFATESPLPAARRRPVPVDTECYNTKFLNGHNSGC